MAFPRLQKESEGSLALTGLKLQLKACGSDLAALAGSSKNEAETTNNTQKESGNAPVAAGLGLRVCTELGH